MKDRLRSLLKPALIGVGALIISTLGIQASDLLRGVDGSLSGLLSESDGPCGEHAVQILNGPYSFCMDVYEASPSKECPHQTPQSDLDTTNNLGAPTCVAESKPGVTPWRFVSLSEAQQFCARAGKRLPTSDEWYVVARSVANPEACAVETPSNSALPTGSAECVTVSGVHDTVGNLWEWMNETVTNGRYDERALPSSGYVAMVDEHGMVVETSEQPLDEFGEDYAWVDARGVRGILRGGFYGSGSDGGVFTQNLSVSPNLKTGGVGFRCVQDL